MKSKIKLFVFTVILLLSCHTKSFVTLNEFNNSEDIKEAEVYNLQHYTVTFAAVGDNLFHHTVYGRYLENGVYNLAPIFSEVKSIIENADLAFVNQETVMAGSSFGYSGFPRFNTPAALAQVLADTGFDIVSLANNHAMDMRAEGLYATLDLLDTIEGLTVIGARRSGESAKIVTRNNISFGFLGYTFSTGWYPNPRDNPNLVSVINREVMTKEISELRPLCDFLIVSMHWGDEYRLQPGRDQIELAQFMAELNVDVIIGHHPHVLQRVDIITLPNGRQTLCYYSLGNFVSHQIERETLIGGMAVMTFSKEELFLESGELTEQLTITEIGLLPLVTHYDHRWGNTKVFPLYAYTEELLRIHRHSSVDPLFTMNFLNSVPDRLNVRIVTENPFLGVGENSHY